MMPPKADLLKLGDESALLTDPERVPGMSGLFLSDRRFIGWNCLDRAMAVR
jgi:hypothetical protein